MKDKVPEQLERFRIKHGELASSSDYGFNGAFMIPYHLTEFRIICSDTEKWDHVSISTKDRCPTWDEMCYFKDLFFKPEETVVQFHPPQSKYVNRCKNCLHLWREQNTTYELPPTKMI
jgi:hypothetical protein